MGRRDRRDKIGRDDRNRQYWKRQPFGGDNQQEDKTEETRVEVAARRDRQKRQPEDKTEETRVVETTKKIRLEETTS